ncbi:putative reverse transcriptase domain-containing protein [Tanacetum coccineum]|uniref:Reverse transcriptase domain-containing protein n=1 Tax=Tanacetum coccineum TaxID=301880 RepID=A0ABQ5BXK8_9ASTR
MTSTSPLTLVGWDLVTITCFFSHLAHRPHSRQQLVGPLGPTHQAHRYHEDFSTWLLNIGDGTIGEPDETDNQDTFKVDIPSELCILDSDTALIKLINFIYNDTTFQTPTPRDLQKKVIACQKNESADMINVHVLSLLNHQQHVYLSSDEATPHVNDGEIENFTLTLELQNLTQKQLATLINRLNLQGKVAFRHFRDAFSVVFGLSLTQVTYTSVYTDSETWRFQWVFYDEPEAPEEDPYVKATLQALPPSPDYVSGPEHPPSPDYVPALSPGYVANFDLEEDEDEEDPADYPANRGDNDDDDESSDKDNDDDDDDDDEEEEHLAPTDSIAFAFLVDHAPSAEETKLFETDESAASLPPHPAYRVTARMSIRPQTYVPFLFEEEVERLLALPTLPPSPLTLLSSPLPQIPSPPLPASPTYPLGYKAYMAIMRAAAPSTYYLIPRSETPPSATPPLLPIPLPTPSPLLLLPSTDYRADMPEIRRDTERDVVYRITDSWDEIVEAMQDRPTTEVTNVAELNQRMTDFATTVRQDTDEIYERLDDAQDDRVLTSSWLNMLHRDTHAHARTARLMEAGIRLSREAWRRSMDASDIARFKTMALRTTIMEN